MGELLELVEDNMHGYVQQELAGLKECAPDIEARKEYFAKHPAAYYRAMNDTVATEQKIKAGGYGNNASKSLTINLNGMGLMDKQKLLKEMTGKLDEMGKKMGYGRKAEVIEVKAKIVGENRMKDE